MRTRNTSENLLKKAREAASRYIVNIASSRSFRNDVYDGRVETARGREYSQNTYLGINAG